MSNKKDSFSERSHPRSEYKGSHASKRSHIHNVEKLDRISRDGELVSRPHPGSEVGIASNLIVRKHLDSNDDIDYEEHIEPHQAYIKDRNTQTPVRFTEHKGVQYGKQVQAEPSQYLAVGCIGDATDTQKSIQATPQGDKLPYSSIKK